MLSCHGKTINEAWKNAICSFMQNYDITMYEGRESAIVDDLIIYVEYPWIDEKLHEFCLWRESVKDQYINTIESQYSANEINRMYTPMEQGLSQYDLLLCTLKNMNTDRPVFVSLYNPKQDLAPHHSLPCLIALEFQIKKDLLNIKAYFSIINLYTHGLLDMNQISCLHRKICNELSCKSGNLTVYASHSVISVVDSIICKEIIYKNEPN